MSLNKVMLIGNVGKDPDIRYIDNGVCTAQVSLAKAPQAIRCRMVHKCPNAPNGIVSTYGADLPKSLNDTFTKATSYTLKANYAIVLIPIKKVPRIK